MRVRRWAALWLVLVALVVAAIPGAGAGAQYDDGLPAGLSQVTVDEQPIDASNTPQVATRTPVFAGRLARGTTQVELALGNGEIVRFTLEVNAENGRFRGSAPDPVRPGTYALYVNDALVGTFVVTEDATAGGGAAGAATTGATLDLARMVPYPFDLDEPYPGLAAVVQEPSPPIRYYNLAEQARRPEIVGEDATRETIQEVRRQYEAAGFRGLYEIRIAAPAEDDPRDFSVQINGAAIEYASAENAEAEFRATVETQLPSEGGAPVEDAATVGDESQVFRRSGVASSTGVAYRSATLVFRRDRVIVRVDIADLRNREPEQSTIEELGGVLVDQVEGVLAGESVQLSRQALELDLSAATGVPRVQQLYEAVDGILIPRYLEEQASLEARAASFAGATDVYTSSSTASIAVPGFQGEEAAQGEDAEREARQQERQRQRAERESQQGAEETPRAERTPRADRTPQAGRTPRADRTPRAGPAGTPAAPSGGATPAATPGAGAVGESTVAYAVTLYAFPGDAEAEAWLGGLPERIDQDPLAGYLRFAPVEDAPSVGDGSAAYSFDRREGDETVSGVRYYVRLGAEVAALELAAPVEPPIEAVQGLVEAQLACLEADACPEPAPLPFGEASEATE